MSRRGLAVLSPAECEELLRAHNFGRVVTKIGISFPIFRAKRPTFRFAFAGRSLKRPCADLADGRKSLKRHWRSRARTR